MPLLAALLLYALTVLTFLACQLYCAQTHGLVDNRNVRRACMRAEFRSECATLTRLGSAFFTQRRALFATWQLGLGARLWAAHLNANEALAAFAPAAAAAAAVGAPATPAAQLAVVVVVARVAHAACYAAARDTQRSIAYAVAAHCTAALYALCVWPAAVVWLLRLV